MPKLITVDTPWGYGLRLAVENALTKQAEHYYRYRRAVGGRAAMKRTKNGDFCVLVQATPPYSEEEYWRPYSGFRTTSQKDAEMRLNGQLHFISHGVAMAPVNQDGLFVLFKLERK